MKRPQKILMTLIALAGSCFAAAERATLDKVFAEPPARSGINVWWHWQGANVTKYGITRDLESMKKAGVASATIFNIQDVGWNSKERFKDPFCPGMTYMSPEWFEMVGFAVREAKRLGLEIGLHNCPGYSTSGGPWIAPALGMKKLVWTKGTSQPETKLWHRPYRTVLSLDAGLHRLTVKVTNVWTNRLIGDEKEPDDCVLAKEMAGFGPPRNRIKEFIPIGRPVVEVPAALRTNGARTVNRFAFSTWRYNLTDKDLRPAGLIGPVSLAPLARWRGFNLMEMFTWWPKHEKPAYREDDFRFIRENGFNFVRLPIDYRFWTHGGDWSKIDAEWVKPVDDAIELGGKYGIHVQINLHRGPGYCVNRGETEPKKLFGPEASEEARKVFAQHWEFLAKRYAKYPNARVSFDLINEPADVSEEEYVAAVRPAIAAIRAVSPDRLIFSDGRAWGNRPTHLLADDPNIAQAMRGYQPMTVSHYQANWVRLDPNAKPVWPPAPAAKKAKYDDPGLDWLYTHNFKAWDELAAKGVLVMMGEFGIFNKTPHDVSLAALEDNLRMLKERDWGWALWNLRGSFGPIDSGRSDVEYEDMNGHKLDRKMLELLKRY